MFAYLVVAFGKLAIPLEFSLLSLLFVLFEVLAFVAAFIHGSLICGFVYNRGIGRRLFAFVLGYAAMLVTLAVFGVVFAQVVDYLP